MKYIEYYAALAYLITYILITGSVESFTVRTKNKKFMFLYVIVDNFQVSLTVF